VLDTVLQVYQPTGTYTTKDVPVGKQLDNNFRQTVALSINIPIFNAWQSSYNVKQARINMLTSELNKYQAELKLKQDVYKAYNDARNSIQKYYAAERAATAAQRAFDFAQKRYDLGLTNTVDYLVTQNTLYTASSNLARAKYDLIFKLKVIDYYLGKELKL
jgi:outer membrane protein